MLSMLFELCCAMAFFVYSLKLMIVLKASLD